MHEILGQTVAHYRVESLVGEGGMAAVYLAQDLKHGRPVALKIMKPELAATLGAERFLREIKTTALLSHPLIVPLLDSGRSDDLLFFAMPYFPEGSLRARLERDRTLGLEEAIRLTEGLAEALDHAHKRGCIHRDIKPGNILLSGGKGCVADFGIATAVSDSSATTLTQSGFVVGTPIYMSPEHLLGAPIDGRSDLYSLACVTLEMISGKPPLVGTSSQLRAWHAAGTAPDLRKDFPNVTHRLASVFERALAKDPAQRPRDGLEFVHALRSGRVLPKPRHRRWVRDLVVAGAALVIVGLAVWGAMSAIRPPHDGPMRLLRIEPAAGSEFRKTELEGTSVTLLVESALPGLRKGYNSSLELASAAWDRPRPTGNSGIHTRVIAVRPESKVLTQQILRGELKPEDVDLDGRIHLTVFRTVFEDGTQRLLSRTALASIEYGVRWGFDQAEGTFRLIRTQPIPETSVSRAALRRGVPVKVVFESSVTRVPKGYRSWIALMVDREPEWSGGEPILDLGATLARRKEAPFPVEGELQGTVRERHVTGNRVWLEVVRATCRDSTDQPSVFESLATFGYDVGPGGVDTLSRGGPPSPRTVFPAKP